MLLLGVLFLLSSCNENAVFNAHKTFSSEGWEMYNTQQFDVEIEKTTHYNIDIFLRHDNQYKYRNIWLFIDHINPDSTTTTDTINITLADEFGNWVGGGTGSSHQAEENYLHLHTLDSGTHHIKITQGMREYKLKGINNIGVRITPATTQ